MVPDETVGLRRHSSGASTVVSVDRGISRTRTYTQAASVSTPNALPTLSVANRARMSAMPVPTAVASTASAKPYLAMMHHNTPPGTSASPPAPNTWTIVESGTASLSYLPGRNG